VVSSIKSSQIGLTATLSLAASGFLSSVSAMHFLSFLLSSESHTMKRKCIIKGSFVSFDGHIDATCSFGWCLMAGAGLFRDKSTVGWLLVADLF
jgi:hypothetical protein